MSTPVRVSFTMRTPMVIPSVDKHLDAFLSWAAVQQAEFNGHDDPWATQHDLGIAKLHVGDDWCFKASLVECQWAGERSQLHYIKRSKLEDYAEAYMDGLLDRRPAFDAARGSTKAGSYIAPIRWATTVDGFAIVEDMKRFMELLPWVTHIGKLRHKDYGAVRGFAVTEDPIAYQHWFKRNLPMGSPEALAHAKSVGGLMSPYWNRANHKPVMAYAA